MQNAKFSMHNSKFKCVTADSNLNNGFKLLPILGSSCFQLANQDSRIQKDCIFQLIWNSSIGQLFLTLRNPNLQIFLDLDNFGETSPS